ncbi:MAG: ABC transporter permease [Halobacteriovoraceae bacterium]|nr:ABC transporter permease [Halobacteriovoraceae bacterium]
MQILSTKDIPIYNLKKRLLRLFYFIGELFYLFLDILKCSFSRPFYFYRVIEQIVSLGVQSISITVVIGFAMGTVMTLNFGYGLSKFGGTLYVPGIVSLSILREMAPIFTSLLVAGRIGSGMAAEIGSMNVNQQVDAIRAMGTSPIRVLVVPRFWASVISLPLLTGLAGFLGLVGGAIIANGEFQIPPPFYINKVIEIVKIHDFASGLLKTSIFGGIIAVVGCYKGLRTKDGTRGVGESTTYVVVISSIIILITNFFLSKLFFLFWLQ